jgi:hypothetical protein
MGWTPSTDYGPSEYLNDVLGEGSVKDVTVANDCVIKEYDNGRVSMYIDSDNEKGHDSYDMKYDDDGNFIGAEPHRSN